MELKKLRDKVRLWADKYNLKLLSTDDRFRSTSVVIHEDGSVFFLRNCFLIRVDTHFVVAFSEHVGVHIWMAGDLANFFTFDAPAPVEDISTRDKLLSREQLVKKLIGMEESAAVKLIKRQGLQSRVTSRDGVAYTVTRDYRKDRINLRCDNEKVTFASTG